nr:reverse transcriptase domain-containing protein [Tanacetum cinerariifolium]
MSTRSSARNLFPTLDNPELTIRRRSRTDPTLLNDSEMAAEGPSDLPVPDLRTMEELCQPSLNGRGGPIAPIAIQATNFGLKNDMIKQSIKVNGVTDDTLRLYLFPHSLTHHVTAGFDRLPRNSINTFEQMATMFLGKYFPPSMVTKFRNEITNFCQHPDELLFKAWKRYKLSIDRCPNLNMLSVTQIDTFYNGLTLRHHDTINAAAGGTFIKKCPKECYDLIENMTAHHNDWDTSAQRSESSSSINSSSDTEIAALKAEMAEINKNLMRVLQVNQQVKAVTPNCETCGGPHSFSDCPAIVGNTQNVYVAPTKAILTNLKATEYLKGITTRSGTAYQGPMIPTTSSSLPPVVERETEATNDTVHPTNNGSTKDVQPPVVQTESLILNSEPIIAPIIKPVSSPVSASKPNQRPSIPYPSRLHDQKLRDKANDQREKIFQIFKDLNFNISFADALIQCQILLKKFLEKLGDPDKFLIPCDFPGMAECLALADLGASINLMPLFVWNKLSLPDLSPTCMTLELTDHLISRSVRVAKDVFDKVGTFHFPADFVVVDFDANPRIPLILGRSFLKTRRALIDVFEGELTLRVGEEAITFNLDQTSRYSTNYNDMTANRIDIIDMDCEKYSQEVLGFSDMIASGNPTPYYDLIVSITSPTLTPFGNKAFLNDDPSLPPPNQGNYLPQVRKELKICEAKTDKSSIDEPLEVELKDLPPYLEYIFLEGDDKLPVIIAKDLSIEEKTALITVLKSHKRAIAWKLFDIKGIDSGFYTYKILMVEDFEPAVQHQRRVNPKIHDVIKNKVLKLLDAGLIYLISDSPWVSPVNYVPKKGGFTVVENEENELIPTRLVTGWHVCIDYCKLNEATRKDRFPLPFMDQMLERLAGNRYYCFLDGFIGYFQIPIDLKDQEKTYSLVHMERLLTVACLLGYAMHQARFRERMLKRCEDTDLCLNWEKSHFMVKEGIVPSHKIFKNGIEVDKAKVNVIAKLPHPTTVKAPILIAPDWDMPFELMCDASDFAIGAVLGQRQEKHFRTIHYASKTMNEAESNYTITEKEMLAV